MAEPRQRHVLVVDGAADVADLLREILEEEGYRVSVAAGAPTGPGELRRRGVDLVVLDPGPGSEGLGWRLLRAMERDRRAAEIPVVVCSGATRAIQDALADLKGRGVDFVPKPFDVGDLLRAVGDRLGPSSAVR